MPSDFMPSDFMPINAIEFTGELKVYTKYIKNLIEKYLLRKAEVMLSHNVVLTIMHRFSHEVLPKDKAKAFSVNGLSVLEISSLHMKLWERKVDPRNEAEVKAYGKEVARVTSLGKKLWENIIRYVHQDPDTQTKEELIPEDLDKLLHEVREFVSDNILHIYEKKPYLRHVVRLTELSTFITEFISLLTTLSEMCLDFNIYGKKSVIHLVGLISKFYEDVKAEFLSVLQASEALEDKIISLSSGSTDDERKDLVFDGVINGCEQFEEIANVLLKVCSLGSNLYNMQVDFPCMGTPKIGAELCVAFSEYEAIKVPDYLHATEEELKQQIAAIEEVCDRYCERGKVWRLEGVQRSEDEAEYKGSCYQTLALTEYLGVEHFPFAKEWDFERESLQNVEDNLSSCCERVQFRGSRNFILDGFLACGKRLNWEYVGTDIIFHEGVENYINRTFFRCRDGVVLRILWQSFAWLNMELAIEATDQHQHSQEEKELLIQLAEDLGKNIGTISHVLLRYGIKLLSSDGLKDWEPDVLENAINPEALAKELPFDIATGKVDEP